MLHALYRIFGAWQPHLLEAYHLQTAAVESPTEAAPRSLDPQLGLSAPSGQSSTLEAGICPIPHATYRVPLKVGPLGVWMLEALATASEDYGLAYRL